MGITPYVGCPTGETPRRLGLYGMMLKEAGEQPGLLTAILIALAGGWAASRMLRRAQPPFPSLVVGITGAVLGMTLMGMVGLRLGAVGLLAASLAGGLLVLAAARPFASGAKRWRKRNHVSRDEFEKRGSTGTQEDP